MGLNTYKVPMSMHAGNRERVCTNLRSAHSSLPANSLIFLQGGEAKTRNDTDHELLFRQEVSYCVQINYLLPMLGREQIWGR